MANHNSFWTFVNRPIVILIVGFTAWPFVSSYGATRAARQNVGGMARGIRDAIDELSDAEVHGELKRIASGIVSQIAQGVQAGLRQSFNGSSGKPDPAEEFRQLVGSIIVSDVSKTRPQHQGRESWLAKVRNETGQPLKQLSLNVAFYRNDGKLVDAMNKWISEIKVLEPEQEIAFRLDRSVGDINADPKEYESFVADRLDIQVANFSVHRPKKVE